jgi:hypothetical protein
MTLCMNRHSMDAVLAACLALIAGACAPAAPDTTPAPPAPAAYRLPPAGWTAESPAGEIAAWAREGCRRAPGGSRACMERTLVGLIDQAGVDKSMEVLDTLLRADAEVRANGHELAHGMGMAAYRSPETMAAAFAACPATQGAGCNHGVVQGYFLALMRQGRLPGTAELDAACEPHRHNTFLYFHCAHALGHGLMAVHGNHVPGALEACDLATDVYVRDACYGGIFMENLVRVTQPHHTTEGHAETGGTHASGGADVGHGEHGAHGGDASGGVPAIDHGEWRALDPDDWLYPCDAVAQKYQPSCYTMQTGAMLYFNAGNVASAGRACEKAPEAMVRICFGSLGRDVIALAGQDHQRSIDLCARVADQAGGRGEPWCMVGAVQNLMNLAADPDEGIRFCRRVAADGQKRDCYNAAGEIIYSLVAGQEGRGKACAAAEPRFVETCRYGARVAPSTGGDAARLQGSFPLP